MSELGKELINALKEAQKKGLQDLHPSPNVKKLRLKLHLTQNQFAELYHLNPETIKKWEQEKRVPDSISRAYLKCIIKAPKTIARIVNA